MSDQEIVLHCPKCGQHDIPKLGVNISLGVFNCFRCGWAGKLRKLYQYPELVSSLEDKVSLSEFAKLNSFKPIDLSHIDALEDLNPVRELVYTDPQYSYLKNRGWSNELMFIYKPLVSLNNKYKDRVILPVIKNDKIVYFTARSIEEHPSMKYKNPSIPRKDVIFESLIPENKFFPNDLVICEGIFDSFSIPNAIALFGKTITAENEINILRKAMNKTNIYVALDSGAEHWIQQICSKLYNWLPNKSINFVDTNKYRINEDLGKMAETMSSFDLLNWIKENSIPYYHKSALDIIKNRLINL